MNNVSEPSGAVHSHYYDPELPFLEDLERHIRARAERSERARSARESAHTRAPAGRLRRLSPLAARMTRRTAILVVLLCLLGTTALGARTLLFSTAQSPVANHQGAFVPVANGVVGSDDWTLNLYTRDGQLCRALVLSGQAESSRCGPSPGARRIGVSTLQSAQHGYVFGVTGDGVRAVRVHEGATALMVATHTLSGEHARVAGLPGSARYFLAVLTRPLGGYEPPATVTGLGPANRLTGGTQIACLQEAGPPPCGP
jgi:hypothetical protein